jgi:hypothetical protein
MLLVGENTVERDIRTDCRFLALCVPAAGPAAALRLLTWQETPVGPQGLA